MSDIPVEKKFAILCQITRAQHFAWHQAVAELCPDVDVAKVTDKMWEITGHETAKAYIRRMKQDEPLAPQVASSIVWSSQCMGEDAALEVTQGKDEAFVRHADCPWFHWHKNLDLLHEDQPGCDLWFQTTIDDINAELGTKIRMETQEALPAGGACCLRRFWVEE